jgi:hypothetical protein
MSELIRLEVEARQKMLLGLEADRLRPAAGDPNVVA